LSFSSVTLSCKTAAAFAALLGMTPDNRFPQSLRIRKQKESLDWF
jgi:hypothetical protein